MTSRKNAVAKTEASLESMLWEAANILRGPVDASDFKAYVFQAEREEPEELREDAGKAALTELFPQPPIDDQRSRRKQ